MIVLALIAGALGFGHVIEGMVGLAQALCVYFLGLLGLSLIFGLFRGR